jgi:hypothetical protein
MLCFFYNQNKRDIDLCLIATNQAANFTAYQEMKKYAQRVQNLNELPSYQHLILGGVSGAMGTVDNTFPLIIYCQNILTIIFYFYTNV